MPITAADLKFFASEAMNDTATGGGRRSGTAVLTGVENNVFPDLSADDVLQGQTRARKLYPSAVSVDGAALLGASVVLNARPSDALVDMALALYGDDTTTRQQFMAGALPVPTISGSVEFISGPAGQYVTLTNGSADVPISASGSREDFYVAAGSIVAFTETASTGATPYHVAAVSAVDMPTGITGAITVTMSAAYAGATRTGYMFVLSFSASPRVYGAATTAAEAVATATSVTLTLPMVRLVPAGATYPTVVLGIAPGGLRSSRGMAPVLAVGDIATLYNEAETAPAARVNTDVVNVGRTNLSQMALVDANGDEVDRALADGPAIDASFTVDLAAGTLTCVDVSGWAQPVSVRHRIEERVLLSAVDGISATFNAALARTFAAGSILVSEVPLGDVQAGTGVQFSQQTWTKAWADTVIGSPVGALYGGVIGLQNDGAEADRWACVFSTATQYTLHSERYGVVGTGNIGTDYVPLNPGTGQPLLTLYATGWVAGGISLGNVFRFNTSGAYGRVWALQCAGPGAGTGPSAALLRLRGSVDA
jgi:hypothetical protein